MSVLPTSIRPRGGKLEDAVPHAGERERLRLERRRGQKVAAPRQHLRQRLDLDPLETTTATHEKSSKRGQTALGGEGSTLLLQWTKQARAEAAEGRMARRLVKKKKKSVTHQHTSFCWGGGGRC